MLCLRRLGTSTLCHIAPTGVIIFQLKFGFGARSSFANLTHASIVWTRYVGFETPGRCATSGIGVEVNNRTSLLESSDFVYVFRG